MRGEWRYVAVVRGEILGFERSYAVFFLKKFLYRRATVVVDSAGHKLWRDSVRNVYGVAHRTHVPVGIAFVEQPDALGRFESGVADGVSAEVVLHCDGIYTVVEAFFLQFDDMCAKLFVDYFVGIYREDICMCGESCGVLSLRTESLKFAACDFTSVSLANLKGTVGAIRIDHNDFVGNAFKRIQASLKVALLVASDDCCGKVIHGSYSVRRYKVTHIFAIFKIFWVQELFFNNTVGYPLQFLLGCVLHYGYVARVAVFGVFFMMQVKLYASEL